MIVGNLQSTTFTFRLSITKINHGTIEYINMHTLPSTFILHLVYLYMQTFLTIGAK